MAKSKKITFPRLLKKGDRDSYVKLRQALDSFTNVALAQYGLSETGTERDTFCKFVSDKVVKFLEEVAHNHGKEWKSIHPDFGNEAEANIPDSVSQCPPGFIRVNGECVPITNAAIKTSKK